MLAGVIETIQQVDVDAMTRRQLESFLETCREVSGAVTERRLAAMKAIDALGDGGLPSSAVQRTRGKASERAAKQSAKTASALDQMPNLKSQLASGRLTEEHVDAAAAAAERTEDPAKTDAALSRLTDAPADLFTTRAGEYAARNEPRDRAERRAARQRRNRKAVYGRSKEDGSWTMFATTETSEGVELRGLIDAEADRLFRADGGRDNPTRPRTDDQRRFDALANLIRRGATGGDDDNRRPHPKYQGVVTIPLTSYLDPDNATGELIGTGPLPRAVVQRILCDSALTALVVDDNGQPLWAGRSTRSANDTQWKALIARDRGCVVCGTAPSRCEAHHLVWWEHHGPTDITNLVLLCTRHHHDLHHHNLHLTRQDGIWKLTPRNRAGPEPPPARRQRTRRRRPAGRKRNTPAPAPTG